MVGRMDEKKARNILSYLVKERIDQNLRTDRANRILYNGIDTALASVPELEASSFRERLLEVGYEL